MFLKLVFVQRNYAILQKLILSLSINKDAKEASLLN